MTKKVFLLVFVLLFVFSMSILAQGFEFTGGATYNTLSIKHLNTFSYDSAGILNGSQETYTAENKYCGPGYFFGGRYWINENLGLGLGYDYLLAYFADLYEYDESWFKYILSNRLSGFYGEIAYKINDVFTLIGQLANYDYENVYIYKDSSGENQEYINYEGNGTGYILKAGFKYPVYKNLKIIGEAGYRHVDITLTTEGEVEMSSFLGSVGIAYEF